MKEYQFSNWVEFITKEEKEEAHSYLLLWKKYLTRKLSNLKFIDEQWSEKPMIFSSTRSILDLSINMQEII